MQCAHKLHFLRIKQKIKRFSAPAWEWFVCTQAFDKILHLPSWKIPTDLWEDTVKR